MSDSPAPRPSSPDDAASGRAAEGRTPEPPVTASPLPEIPAEVREAARLAPDHWLGMVDPAWRGEGPPPGWALVGEWRSGMNGEIEEWRANEDYRPSPTALGWPEPTDDVDEAVQRASTGYGPVDEVPRLLAAAEVSVLLGPAGEPLAARTPDGDAVIPVFTSPGHLRAAGLLASETLRVADLVGRLPRGHRLYLNPTGAVSMVIETETLLAALASGAPQAASGIPGPTPQPAAR
ncbi:type VII secretion system-associated protein [Streptomyces sp. NPDC057062]|uniref:type VII secretion system-associated protein n=1 Tax=Streptomyces sp. NPDC057062 TaxID=3346011 RepID=UPI003629FDD0